MRIWIAGVFALAFASGTAHAADADDRPIPGPNDAASWSGAYIGASAGYGWLRDIDFSFTPPLRSSGEDVIFGGHFGYLRQFDRFVIGGEGDLTRLNINFEGFPIDAENSFSIKARAGFAFDRFLFTGHAGAVHATTNIGLEDWGWIAGAGIDYLVTDNLVAGLSYDHMRFDSFDGTLIDAELDIVKIRFGVKF